MLRRLCVRALVSVAVARCVPCCALPACVGRVGVRFYIPPVVTSCLVGYVFGGSRFFFCRGACCRRAAADTPPGPCRRSGLPRLTSGQTRTSAPPTGARESGIRFLSPTGSRRIMTITVVANRDGRIIFLSSIHAAAARQPHKCIKLQHST